MTLSGQTYRCSAGEMFDLIALKLYGDEKYACDLMCANPALCETTVFTGGEMLQIPIVDTANASQGDTLSSNTAPWK